MSFSKTGVILISIFVFMCIAGIMVLVIYLCSGFKTASSQPRQVILSKPRSVKNAVLISGFLKTYKQSFQIFFDKVIRDSDADVFCVFKKNSSFVCRTNQKLGTADHDEEAFIRSVLGDRLKSLVWIDTVESTQTYITRGENILRKEWLSKYGKKACEKLEHWMNIKNTVDQYQRLKLACKEMSKYSQEHSIHYSRVFRTRADILPVGDNPKDWWNFDVQNRDVFVGPSNKYEMRDVFFLADQETMEFICDGFPDKYLTYTSLGMPHSTILAPECQLLQFLISERKHNIFLAPFCPYVTEIEGRQIILWEDSFENFKKTALLTHRV